MSRQEIALVSATLERNSIYPENSRVSKSVELGKTTYEVLQASIEKDGTPAEFNIPDVGAPVRLIRGDHSEELEHIYDCLANAKLYAANDLQKRYIEQLQQSFTVGDIEPYKESQRIWVKDLAPSVETILGFVEPYRDPHGTRAEFEGIVAFVDTEESKTLKTLVDRSTKFIRRLPWATNSKENDGKGPFEKGTFEPPDFTSIHEYSEEMAPAFLCPTEAPTFLKHKYHAFYLWVVIHELLGHGTGKLLTQVGPNEYNFDIENPPIDPLTGRPVECWYRPGQTWTGVFGDLATTIDECRAECVGAYLMSDEELLAMFGFDDHTEITADDLTYNLYLQLGVGGLRALENYIVDDRKWGQAHSRAHFAMLRVLLDAGNEFLRVEYTKSTNSIIVHVNRTKILSHGRPAIASLLLRLHIYRCTADVEACRSFYEGLTAVEGVFLEWREVVLAKKKPRHVFVQANTVLEEDGTVILREYSASAEGMIQSWAERGL
ncbi:MAG: bifunctional diacylglycerol diphosphate phosphatase/phosphatidate phosphatase [Candelina submexicana]|nr:MAG: bifunctional diacylglycerol diphosphate phosphatase/phosphatidate phosphatase [Candelina submexicana]